MTHPSDTTRADTTRADTSRPGSTPARATLVLGLGKTGYSVIEHLSARGEKITVADSRDLPPFLALVRERYPQVEVITGGLPAGPFTSFNRVVVSPGIAVESRQHLIGDIELFVESATAPIIAITGSNGKSTVTTLVSDMLVAAGSKVLTGGNIGTPALELLTHPVPDFYVLELSSFQLEKTYSLKAAAATVLNISEDHMDRYPHIDQYIEAKARVLHGAGCCVLNRDDTDSCALLKAHPGAISFGLDRPVRANDYGLINTDEGQFLCVGELALAPVNRLTMQGEQNIANALAALALVQCARGRSAAIPIEQPVIGTVLGFAGLEHRCELVAEINGVKWINDSKGTNVGATVAAINGFGDNLILIAGGIGKGADFSPLKESVDERVSHVILFGQDADLIAEAIDGETRISRTRDLAQAVSVAAGFAQEGQVVLFSPACSSFDMFENYEQRGAAFKRLVTSLASAQ